MRDTSPALFDFRWRQQAKIISARARLFGYRWACHASLMALIRSIFAGNIWWVKIRVDRRPVYQSSDVPRSFAFYERLFGVTNGWPATDAGTGISFIATEVGAHKSNRRLSLEKRCRTSQSAYTSTPPIFTVHVRSPGTLSVQFLTIRGVTPPGV